MDKARLIKKLVSGLSDEDIDKLKIPKFYHKKKVYHTKAARRKMSRKALKRFRKKDDKGRSVKHQ